MRGKGGVPGDEQKARRRGEIVQVRWDHRDVAPYLRLAVPNYARRQQYRRLVHAGEAALGSVIVTLLGLVILSTGAAALAGLLFLSAVGLGYYARHWLSLASRSRVGARSEDEVQRALAPLEAEGWRLRHSLPGRVGETLTRWRSRPSGIAIAIETKTGRTTHAISLGCGSRWTGCRGAGEDGHATARLESCVSFVRVASSASRMTCS